MDNKVENPINTAKALDEDEDKDKAPEENLLKISAVSTLGSTYDEIETEQEGDRILIAFNNRFLLDSLRASDAEKVKISMTSALTSINIEPAEEDEESTDLFMLLPVRMKE